MVVPVQSKRKSLSQNWTIRGLILKHEIWTPSSQFAAPIRKGHTQSPTLTSLWGLGAVLNPLRTRGFLEASKEVWTSPIFS